MSTDGSRTVSELARMSGVTVRALHHYDAIGLLTPSGRTSAGYRTYSPADTERLAHIVAYRACGLTLEQIGEVLDADDASAERHLDRQLDLIDERMAELGEQRRVLARAKEARRMGINLDPQEILAVFGTDDPTQYAREAEERWGDTDAYRESHRRTSSYTADDWRREGEERAAIEQAWADLLSEGIPATDERAGTLAEAHRLHIDRWFYPCSYDMQVGLAEMYVADPRFAAHYDDRAPGLAGYVRDAIVANAIDRIS